MQQDSKKINSYTEDELMDYITNQLYLNLNNYREIKKISKFSRDDAAEQAIKDFLFYSMESEHQLDEKLKEKKSVGKLFNKITFSKKFQVTNNLDNYAIFKNFSYLFDENLANNKNFLTVQECHTHIGIGINYHKESNTCTIYCVLSQKSLCADECFSVKDGIIIKGQMMEPNCYLFGVQLTKNRNSNCYLGPGKIFFNKDTSKFTIAIPNKAPFGSGVFLGMRKVHFYVQNSPDCNDIPYLNPDYLDNQVPWDNLELALMQTIIFSKLPERKGDTIEKYLTGDNYSFSNHNHNNTMNNNILNNNINNTVIKSNIRNNIQNSGGSISTNNKNSNSNVLEFDFTNNNKPSPRMNNHLNNNTIKLQNSGGFFNPNFLNKNQKNNQMMGTIPEENSILISENNSNYNSLRKLSNNLAGMGNGHTSAFNNNFSDNQIRNNLGSKLQQAEKMRNNGGMSGINQVSNQNNHFNNANYNMDNNHYGGNNANQMSNVNNNQGNFLQHKNYQNSNSNNYFPIQNNMYNKSQSVPGQNANYIANHLPRNSYPNQQNNNLQQNLNNYNQSNYPHFFNSINTLLTPLYLITNVQNVPINNNYKSLLELKNLGGLNNNNFLHINSHQTLLLKDSNFTINLNKVGNIIGGGMGGPPIQQIAITTQSRAKFAEMINDFLLGKLNKISDGDSNTLKVNQNKNLALSNLFQTLSDNNENSNLKFLQNLFSNIPNSSVNNINKNPQSSFDILNNHPKSNLISKIFNNTNKKETPVSNVLKNYQNLNKSAVKFGQETKHKERDNNIYTIDHYIFKEILNQQEKNSNNNKNTSLRQIEEMKHISSNNNERILEKLGRKYLTENEFKGNCNSNPVFEELYKTMSCYDIIITIKNEDITAHKVVLISQSPVFKEMIEVHENKMPNEIIKIILPDSFKPSAFKEVMKWVYSGKISENFDILFLRDMLIIADSLKIFPLQKILIVKYIIPNMSKEASIKFLKDSYKKKTASETTEVWGLLANFSLNCIAKNSSILLKNNRNEFLGMEMDLLFTCIERSVFYLVEDIHLSNLIKIIIDRGYASDVFDLLVQLSKNYSHSRNHHMQNVDVRTLIKNFDPLSPVEYHLINDETAFKNADSRIERENNLGKQTQNNINNNHNSSLENKESCVINQNKENSVINSNPELAKNKIEIIDIKKLTSNSPATNYVKDVDIKKNKPPTFTFSFTINNQPEENSKNFSPCSLFSESFNTNSRSWNLKIDINSVGDVSFFLVERGQPVLVEKHSDFSNLYQDRFSLRFNSILFEFEIRDISFEKSCVIFYSFVSDHNQIVGYENFFNIKQLGKKENFFFNIWIKEFPLHSACLQYVSDNFQSLSLARGGKEINNSTHNNVSSNNNVRIKECPIGGLKTFYDLLPHDIAYILHSDYLKVDNENNVLTAVYRYTINKASTDIDCILNAIRYKFIDLKLLCTTARDHESIKNSLSFKRHFYQELDRRINIPNTNNKEEKKKDNLKIQAKPKSLLSEIKQDLNLEREEKLINLDFKTEESPVSIATNGNNSENIPMIRQQVERKFYSFKDDKRKVFNITEELASFFLEKEHHTGYVKEIERLKKLFEEEKSIFEKKEASFALQKREMQMEIQRLNDRESKRRKLIANNNVAHPNLENKSYDLNWLKSKVTGSCLIF